jgi:hypothetical protein
MLRLAGQQLKLGVQPPAEAMQGGGKIYAFAAAS